MPIYAWNFGLLWLVQGKDRRSETEKRGPAEADDLYNTFMTEVVTYGPGYAGLDPEKREAAGQVHDAYYSLKGDTNPPDLEEDMNIFDQ